MISVDYTNSRDPNVADAMVVKHIQGLRGNAKYHNALLVVGVESNYGGSQAAKRITDVIVPTDPSTAIRHQYLTDGKSLGQIVLIDNDGKKNAGVPGAWTAPGVKEGASRVMLKSLQNNALHLGAQFLTQAKGGQAEVLEKICAQMGNFRDTPKPMKDPVFGTPGHILNGKAGGQKDDICVCIQLNLWWRLMMLARPSFRQLCQRQGIEF